MDEDFLDVTQKSNSSGIIFLFIVVVIAVLGYFLVFKKVYFSAKTVKVELGSTLETDVQKYLSKEVKNKEDYKLNLSSVNTNEVGEYSYTITYNKTSKKGKIKVVDTTPPEFTLETMTIEEGNEDYYLGDVLSSCIELSKPCLVSLKKKSDEEKLKTAGTYNIDITVEDIYGNKKDAVATIVVVPEGQYVDPRTQDLEYASNSQKTNTFDGTIYEKLETAISPSDESARDKLSDISTIDLESYVNANYPGYKLTSSEIIELYNKSSYIIGYAIELKISNGTEKTVYVDKAKVTVSSESNDDE